MTIWTEYKQTRSTAVGQISVTSNGLFTISADLTEKHFPEGTDYAKLYFAEAQKLIGIEPVRKGTPNALKTFRTGRRVALSALGFLKYSRLTDNPEPRHYSAKWQDGKIVFSWDEKSK